MDLDHYQLYYNLIPEVQIQIQLHYYILHNQE